MESTNNIPATYVLASRSEWRSEKLDKFEGQAEALAERYRTLVGRNVLSSSYVYRICEVRVKGKVVVLEVEDYKLQFEDNPVGIHELNGMFKAEEFKLS